MKKIHTIVLVIMMGSLSLFAKDLTVYNLSKHSQAVRSMSMGRAFTAVAEGESSIIINPAGLSYPGGAYSYQYLDYDGLLYKTYTGQFFYSNPIGYSKVHQEDLLGNKLKMSTFGFGVLGKKGISWGVNYKSISGTLNNEKIEGWSSDLGILMRLYPWLNIGANFKDLYSKDLGLSTTFNLGIAGFIKKNTLIWSVENVYDNETKKVITSRGGAEYMLTDTLTLRSGVEKNKMHAGAAFYLPGVQVDIGLENGLNDGLETRYSVSAQIGRGAAAAQYRKRYALFKKAAYAEFAIGGNMKHGKSEISLLGGYKVGSNDLLTLIHLANEDPTCEGYIIRIGNLSTSLATVGMVEEIRKELEKAKEKEKKVFVYIEHFAGLSEYYLASVADMIVMPPLGSVGQFGLDIETQKAASFLEKLGIKTHVITSGKYKASTGTLSDELSELDKVQLKGLIETLFAEVVGDIKKSRDRASGGINYISDGRLITAQEAIELELVDQLAYWPEVYAMIDEYDQKIEKLAITEFIPYEPFSVRKLYNRIAVLEVDGAITLGDNSTNIIFGGSSTGADEFDQSVEDIVADFSIRGVIIRVNSPGGSVLAADRIYEAINRLKASGKLVYTSMGSIATSGGYYVAANSDQIYANRASLTGSIGVVSSLTTFDTLQQELGVKRNIIKTGKYMDLYSSFKTLTEEEKKLIQVHQDNFYQEFVKKVKNNRQLSESEVYVVAQGQLVTGKQAKSYKLVDKVGNLYDVVSDMSEELDIKDPNIIFVRSKSKFNIPLFDSGVIAKIKAFVKFLN